MADDFTGLLHLPAQRLLLGLLAKHAAGGEAASAIGSLQIRQSFSVLLLVIAAEFQPRRTSTSL
jgi:hypothetical protein